MIHCNAEQQTKNDRNSFQSSSNAHPSIAIITGCAKRPFPNNNFVIAPVGSGQVHTLFRRHLRPRLCSSRLYRSTLRHLHFFRVIVVSIMPSLSEKKNTCVLQDWAWFLRRNVKEIRSSENCTTFGQNTHGDCATRHSQFTRTFSNGYKTLILFVKTCHVSLQTQQCPFEKQASESQDPTKQMTVGECSTRQFNQPP